MESNKVCPMRWVTRWALYEDEVSPSFLWSMGGEDWKKVIEEVTGLEEELFQLSTILNRNIVENIGGVYLSLSDFGKGEFGLSMGHGSSKNSGIGSPMCANEDTTVRSDLKRDIAV